MEETGWKILSEIFPLCTQENGIFSHAIGKHNRHSVVKFTQKEMEFFSGILIHVNGVLRVYKMDCPQNILLLAVNALDS